MCKHKEKIILRQHALPTHSAPLQWG